MLAAIIAAIVFLSFAAYILAIAFTLLLIRLLIDSLNTKDE